MLDSLTNAVQIIDANIADARQRGADVDKDERDIARFQVVEKGLFHAERDDGDAVDATLNHATDGMGKTPGVVNGGAGEDFVVVLDGDIFKSLNNLGEDRKSTRLNSSHPSISYAVFCLKKKTKKQEI